MAGSTGKFVVEHFIGQGAIVRPLYIQASYPLQDQLMPYRKLGYNNRNWGFMIDDDVPRFKWFKLELEPQALEEAERRMREYCKGWTAVTHSECPPAELVETFLRKLFQRAEKVLRAALTEHILRTVPVEYVVTHPTTWSAAAVDAFELCAEEAGMGDRINLHVLDEPAAAAWYVLQSNFYNLGHGDSLIICDAGGSTVDLVSYQIRFSEPFFSEPPFKLDLLSPEGRSRICGSSFVDRTFDYNLHEHMKNAPGWNDEYRRKVGSLLASHV
jgi:molecular chaperone DnaK (HSP70)